MTFQGATKETAGDFLRMIIEKGVKIVVMLTQIYEGEPLVVSHFYLKSKKSIYLTQQLSYLKLKCWPYWDDNKLSQFGLISSEVKAFENHFFYEKRLIEIKYLVF